MSVTVRVPIDRVGNVHTGPGVCHTQQKRLRMLQLKILVRELLAIDRLAARAIARREVAALDHELLDDPVERGTLVAQRLARLTYTFLARAESPEVLGCLGNDGGVELEDDTACGLAADADVEEDAWARGG